MVTKSLLGMMLTLGLAGCESSRPPVTKQSTPAPATGAQSSVPPGGAATVSPSTQTTPSDVPPAASADVSTTAPETTSLPITLDEKDLQTKYGLDTKTLSYHVSYLSMQRGDALAFNNGKATVTFYGLPSNQKGDLTFEIVEGSTVKLRGVSKDLTLTPGSAHVSLDLKPVDGQGGNLTVGGQTAGGTTTPPNTGGTATNAGSTGANAGSTATSAGSTATNTGGTATNAGSTATNTGSTATNAGSTAANAGSTTTNSGGTTTKPPTGNGPSYAQDVKPLLDKYCTECHHAGGNAPDLSSPPTSAAVDRIVARASATSAPMPPAPRDPMASGELDKIKAWRDGGLNP